ncbi:hypothetical protein A374_16278 [Fictibacillus macauensis ZFHKF-1]|uniref:Suppressor of fused-like domain-containing protein n=1 Tax=Fictibacillus macauensis ZFHKF-1 TaxID=1196324 RepID=I8UBN7_9BACL|nr:suppressor of fused domain protein [Fictibacillus macauensis]EIT84360.1 hypothetical protein A374_16278 [Fictibacillus macauensis ZFHKF-1]
MMEVSNDMQMIANHLNDISPKALKIARFVEEEGKLLDVVRIEDLPFMSAVTFATIGLCHHDIGYTINDRPLRTELIGACTPEFEWFANVIVTCALYVAASDQHCAPGTVFPDVVSEIDPEGTLHHVMVVSPFQWDALQPLELEETSLTWLQAVPISEAELSYAKEHGSEQLLEQLLEKGANLADLRRTSIV